AAWASCDRGGGDSGKDDCRDHGYQQSTRVRELDSHWALLSSAAPAGAAFRSREVLLHHAQRPRPYGPTSIARLPGGPARPLERPPACPCDPGANTPVVRRRVGFTSA